VPGNVGTRIAFRLGLADAEILERQFCPELKAADLIGLQNYHAYLELVMDGVISRPFVVETLRIPG
jgi:hypothetical protein